MIQTFRYCIRIKSDLEFYIPTNAFIAIDIPSTIWMDQIVLILKQQYVNILSKNMFCTCFWHDRNNCLFSLDKDTQIPLGNVSSAHITYANYFCRTDFVCIKGLSYFAFFKPNLAKHWCNEMCNPNMSE